MKEIHAAFPPKFRHMEYIIINGEKYINSAFEYEKTFSIPTDKSEVLTTKEANA